MPGIFGCVGVDKSTKMKIDGKLMIHNQKDEEERLGFTGGCVGCVHLKQEELAVAEDDFYVVAFYGEIFSDEKQEYMPKPLKSAKALLARIRTDGTCAVETMNGIFLIAIYDKVKEKLLLYNDRFGLYPLYYTTLSQGGFAFASEAKVLFSVMNPSPDYAGIAEYLSLDYCLEDRTFFKNVKYILPALRIEVSNQSVQKGIYWIPPAPEENDKGEAYYLDQLHNVYEKSVQVRSTAPPIIGLSGGMDSRLLLGILGKDRNVYTYNFGNLGSGDVIGASELAKIYSTNHYFLSFDKVDVVTMARDIVWRSDGQGSFEKFYIYEPARQKALIPDGIEISGIGGDAVSGQKSNFTGLFPRMEMKMTASRQREYRGKMLSKIMRGRLSVNTSQCYGQTLKAYWNEVEQDYSNAMAYAENGKTFGDFSLALKLRTLERRSTCISGWIINSFLPIRFPVYDYRVMDFFFSIPQKYRYGQRLYIKLIEKYYLRAAQAPHSETGRPVDVSHVWRTDFVTVKNVIKDYLGIKRSKYNNSFGFVNEKILSCHNIHELVSHQEPCKEGIFDIKAWRDVEGVIAASQNGNGKALKLLKGIIQVSLLNELFFGGKIKMYFG